jgi:integrase
MAYADLPGFMTALAKRPGTSARALELLIHTASRTGEVIGARWEEFDLDAALWTVPADRMKAGKEHRVPLAEPVVELLKRLGPGKGLLFVKARDKAMSNMAMAMLLGRMDLRYKITVHGFRSSFRDWVHEETDIASEIAEQALAHQVGSEVERAYRRGDALEKRRELMRLWSSYLEA